MFKKYELSVCLLLAICLFDSILYLKYLQLKTVSLSIGNHISSVCKSAYFQLPNIGGIRSILLNNACAQLIHSLVTVSLDYCNFILYGLPDNSLHRLQKIQIIIIIFI